MKPILIIGSVLIALGIGALAYRGLPYTGRAPISDRSHTETAHEPGKTVRSSPLADRLGRSGGMALIILGIAAKK